MFRRFVRVWLDSVMLYMPKLTKLSQYQVAILDFIDMA